MRRVNVMLCVCVRSERGVAEREQATVLDLLAARKILVEESAHLSSLNSTLN